MAAPLLIGPGGIFVIDHQVWWALDTVTTDPATEPLMVGGQPAARRVATVKAPVAHTLAHHLPDASAVHPILVVDGPTFRHQRLVAGVTILPIADLPRFLHDRVPEPHADEITTLADHARRLYL